jgi:multidrug efflux pump subunit AcrA (membrane-fusion protein)
MRLDLPPPWRSRPAAIVAGGIALLILMVGFAMVRRPPAGDGAAPGLRTAVIQARPFAATLGLAGVVTAGDVVAVTAPFDGKAARVDFDFGAPVRRGQVLLTLDTSDVGQRRDEAEAEYLKAAQADTDLVHWSNGPEVSQARRAEASAAFDLADTERKIAETKALFDRGLVARDELDGLVQQQRNQVAGLTAARQELTEALKRGSGSNRRVADIELGAAKARLDEIQQELAGAAVRAPSDGVIVRPQSDKTDAAAAVRVGASLTRGQLVAAIARPGGLAVSFQLSEADANRVRPGQSVEVTGPGFEGLTLRGAVATVAREATPASGGAGLAVTFAASARLDTLTPAQTAVIRIGMTANVTVDLYRNPSALTAPPGAIQGTAPDTYVMVEDPRTRAARRVAVRIGQVAPDGVEVLSGLNAGDVVVWTGGAAAGSDDDAS